MNQKILVLASALTLVTSAFACGSEGTGGTTTTTTGAGGSTSSATTGGMGGSGGDPTPAASCAKPGDKGNELGVGTYCSPGGHECAEFPFAGLCLAEVGQDQWFCTKISCKTDAECGTDAVCHMDPQGSGCVPKKCEGGGAGGATASGAGGSGGAGGK